MCSDHNLPDGIFLILFFVSLIDDISSSRNNNCEDKWLSHFRLCS